MILITAPLDTESGYGAKSREIVKPIVEKYPDDVRISFLRWGNTPRTGLEHPKYEFLKKYKTRFTLERQPDLHIHIGLATEFKPRGKKNVLFTSGAESDRISPQWIQAINKVCDMVVVSSAYTRNVMLNTVYEDKAGKELKVEKPVEIIPEAYDGALLEEISDEDRNEVSDVLSGIPEKEWFVTYGQLHKKMNLGSERKNISVLVQEFIRAFRGNKHVALVLKSNPTDFSELSYYDIRTYIQRAIHEVRIPHDQKPSVYILEGYLNPQQLFYLMNHENVVSHVTATHGEGFGRFLLEASLTGKPIVIPKVGSFRDFLSGKSIFYMDGAFGEVPKESLFRDTIIKGSKWYNVHPKEIRSALREVYKQKNRIDGAELAEANREKYALESIEDKILDVVDQYYSKEIEIKMPEL